MDMTCFHTTQWTFPPLPRLMYLMYDLSLTPYFQTCQMANLQFSLCQTKQEKCTAFYISTNIQPPLSVIPPPPPFLASRLCQACRQDSLLSLFQEACSCKEKCASTRCFRFNKMFKGSQNYGNLKKNKNKKIDVLILETRKIIVVSNWLSISRYLEQGL